MVLKKVNECSSSNSVQTRTTFKETLVMVFSTLKVNIAFAALMPLHACAGKRSRVRTKARSGLGYRQAASSAKIVHSVRKASPRRLCLLALAATLPLTAHALQVDIDGPEGSEAFGSGVFALPNGNFVVTDPLWDAPGPVADVGAVYLYGADLELISTLTGSTANDQVGYLIRMLPSGNFLVATRNWDNGDAADAGAVTWVDGETGLEGEVSAANSLVGSTSGDQVGWASLLSLTVLPNGNYVVGSPSWDNGNLENTGASTWADGATGISGEISAANSLVGASAGDNLGFTLTTTVLAQGNYVIRCPNCDINGVTNSGAVIWADGDTGITGEVSASIALYGTSENDFTADNIVALSNGHYVAMTPAWDNGLLADVGAVTWGNGTTGTTGPITTANSIIGANAGDRIGRPFALANGHYVIGSPFWDNGGIVDAGAATWVDGSAAASGVVSLANSLVGSTAGDRVGQFLRALDNGNYVVSSFNWSNNGEASAGAVTWGDGDTGITGIVSPANSLVGSTAGDNIGGYIVLLSNSNYVVHSFNWDNGASVDAGAVTLGDGTTGISGVVSETNSLIGGPGDLVGSGVTALDNGNFVVFSLYWNDEEGQPQVGAVTLVDGETGLTGRVSRLNSLTGSSPFDQIGRSNLFQQNLLKLANGNFVVLSPGWDDGTTEDVGAATWVDGSTGLAGLVSTNNSLTGSSANDRVGDGSDLGSPISSLSNGNYLVTSGSWDNGGVVDAGALTWGDGTTGNTGPVTTENSLHGVGAGDRVGDNNFDFEETANGYFFWSTPNFDSNATTDVGAVTLLRGIADIADTINPANSVIGSSAGGGFGLGASWSEANQELIVGRPADNIVSLRSFLSITALISDGTPSMLGTPVTFASTITGSLPTGTLTFQADGENIEGCVDLEVDGSDDVIFIDCITASLPIGTRQVQAIYSGDRYNDPGSSEIFEQVIERADQVPLIVMVDPPSVRTNDAGFLSTTGGSGTGAVTYEVTAGEAFCGVDGDILVGLAVGTCTITATKAADDSFNATTATLDVFIDLPDLIFMDSFETGL